MTKEQQALAKRLGTAEGWGEWERWWDVAVCAWGHRNNSMIKVYLSGAVAISFYGNETIFPFCDRFEGTPFADPLHTFQLAVAALGLTEWLSRVPNATGEWHLGWIIVTVMHNPNGGFLHDAGLGDCNREVSECSDWRGPVLPPAFGGRR